MAPTNRDADKLLTDLGARKLVSQPSKRVVWLIAGQAKTGKSHLAFDAPGPLGYLNIDKGEEGTVEKFIDGDESADPKDIWAVDIRLTRAMIADPNVEVVKQRCEPLLMSSLKVFDEMVLGDAGANLRSVIVDTWTEFFQLGCFARIGKDKQIMPVERTKVNGIYSSLIHNALYGTRNVLLLAKTTEWEGETKISGYNQSDGLVQTTIMTGKREKLVRDPEGGPKMVKRSVFTYTISECRQNRELMGQEFTSDELGEHPFSKLAAMIVPGTRPRDWR